MSGVVKIAPDNSLRPSKKEKRRQGTTKTMTKSHSQTDISDNGDSKMSENIINTNTPTTPPITSKLSGGVSAAYTDTSRIHGLESPICFADLLNRSKMPTNDFDLKLCQTLEQFKDSILLTVNSHSSDLTKKHHSQKQAITAKKDAIIEQKDKEIEQLRQKLTDVSFECHELSAKNETLETSLSECRNSLRNTKIIYHAFTKWRVEMAKKLFYKQFVNKVLIPYQRRKQQASYFVKWKLCMYTQMQANYDIVWQKRLETVSTQIVNEYEASLAALRKQLKDTQTQCKLLTKERNEMEQNMKRAFMRGVSALNLEAMSLFSRSTVNQPITDARMSSENAILSTQLSLKNRNESHETMADEAQLETETKGKPARSSYNHLLYEQKSGITTHEIGAGVRTINVAAADININEETPRRDIPDRFRN